ncbi:MAG TPA: hypothetical protein VHG69_07490 [Thermoleophilaceae bacterium]|nr:hypothetical protein [Thermoleophilaceae bacterium]
MTLFRLLSPALRSGLLIAIGGLLILTPVVVGLSTAAAAFGLVVGALTIALGLAGTADDGRGTLPILAQAVYDLGLAAGLLMAGVAFGLTGQPWAFALFATAGLATGLIATNTRYSLATS